MRAILPLFVTLLLASAPVVPRAAAASGLQPVALRCEYAVEPLGVDQPQPRLFWRVESGQRGQRQSAFQILVASSANSLAREQGDLWDSGKVVSDETIHAPYGGRALKSSQQVFWKLRVWDKDGEPSDWSQPASWTMGVLSRADWKAHWIAATNSAGLGFDGASWIWHAERDWSKAGASLRPPNVAGGAVRFFQRSFDLPRDARVRRARLLASIDNAGEVWVNGQGVANLTAWERVRPIEVTAALKPGGNLIAIQAHNTGNNVSPAGVLAKLAIELENGRTTQVVSDGSWRSVERPVGDAWKSQPDEGWTVAAILAAWGDGPWKRDVAIGVPGGLPIFRKQFDVAASIRRAVVHVCGLGHYDLFLDGRKVGDRFLDPAWSVYEKTAYYSTFDITAELRPGVHVFGVMLGKGFYNTGGDRRVHGVNTNRTLKLILQAHLTLEDGTEQIIVSDGTWKTTEGPITHSAILGGEDYDARRRPAGWDRAGFDDSGWDTAAETGGLGGALVASYAPPVRAHAVLKSVRIDEPQPGVFVYDFGQNASAVPRLRVRGASGQAVKLTPAEQRRGMSPRRNDGRGLVNQAGVGSPNYWQYTLRGDGAEEWTPQFSYSGFQYLQAEGAVPAGQPNPGGRPVIEGLESVHVRNDAATVGRFECSNPLFNQIDRAVDWAVRANLSHVLTDCPHREKLGWLEVSYLMGPAIAGRYDLARFYSKVARDCADSQGPDGIVPTVAPAYPSFGGGFAYTPEWGAAAVIDPWLVHAWYGDRAVLEANYPAMKGFVDYLRNTSNDLVPRPGLGDWYDYGHGKPVGASQFTPTELSAMATFHRCARIVADTAAVLGRTEDQRRYSELAQGIVRVFNERYFDGIAEYKNHGSPQTANSMALVSGMVPKGREATVLERMVQDIRQRGNQQTAGDIGHWYLLQALAQNGRSDVIFDMTARTNLGSYGFIVRNGWTSMPEAWDADTGASMNHCMLGHIQEWFIGWVAGIRPDPQAPGFRRFVIQPHPVGDLTWARATYDSIRGHIVSDWRVVAGRFELTVTVPANTAATVMVPAKTKAEVSESGRAVGTSEVVKFVRMEAAEAGQRAGCAVMEVGSGTFRFTSAGLPARRN